MTEVSTPETYDNVSPVTDEQYRNGMIISIAVGLYYTFNAFYPILAWYGWRKEDIRTMAVDNGVNKWYMLAWYVMYGLHFIVFSPMAFLWPFTYLGSTLIVDFYDIANLYLGTVAATLVYLTVTTMFFISMLFYKDSTVITRRQIWLELALYVLVEAFAWYTTIWEYPKAHDQFYFGTRGSEIPNPDYQVEDVQPEREREEVETTPFNDELSGFMATI